MNTVLVPALIVGLLSPATAVQFGDVEVLGKVSSDNVDENSGLAASRLHSGIVYGLNDKGDSSRIFAMDPLTGKVRATLEIKDARNYDWEDLCVGTCGQGVSGSCIYIADIGDHGGDGAENIIYKVREPEVIDDDHSLPLLDKYRFTWEEEDAESLMIDPSGDLYIISKVSGGRALFAKLPQSGWGATHPVTIPVPGTALLRLHTTHNDPQGADISPNGQELLVKTEEEVLYYSVPDKDYVKAISEQIPEVVQTYVRREAGESVAWNSAGTGFYTLPEGNHPTFNFYRKLGSIVG